MKYEVFQNGEMYLGIWLEYCDKIETYNWQIHLKSNDYKCCSKQLLLYIAKRVIKMTDQVHQFSILYSLPWHATAIGNGNTQDIDSDPLWDWDEINEEVCYN